MSALQHLVFLDPCLPFFLIVGGGVPCDSSAAFAFDVLPVAPSFASIIFLILESPY